MCFISQKCAACPRHQQQVFSFLSSADSAALAPQSHIIPDKKRKQWHFSNAALLQITIFVTISLPSAFAHVAAHDFLCFVLCLQTIDIGQLLLPFKLHEQRVH